MSRVPALRCSLRSARYADRHCGGANRDSQTRLRRPSATVELVRDLLREPDVEVLAPRNPNERRTMRLACNGPCERPRPLPGALRGDDAEIEQSVVRSRMGERGDVAHDLSYVACENARRVSVEPLVAVDAYPDAESPRAQVPRSGPDV